MMPLSCGWIRNGCVGIALLAPLVASGGTVYWNMNDLTTPTSNTVGNLTVSPISQVNTTTTGGTTTLPSSGYTFLLNSATTTASGSFNLTFSAKTGAFVTGSSSYLTVTLTPTAGYSGTVNAIGFGARSTGGGPTTLSLRSSLDGYAADVASFSSSTNSNWAYFTNSFSSPVAFSNSSPLTMRLYGSGGSSVTSGNWRIDDLQLDVVVVPEPASIVLGMLAVAGATIVARRAAPGRKVQGKQCGVHEPVLRSSSCSS